MPDGDEALVAAAEQELFRHSDEWRSATEEVMLVSVAIMRPQQVVVVVVNKDTCVPYVLKLDDFKASYTPTVLLPN